MKQYLSLMSRNTKWKCAGVVALAFVTSMLASIWPVKLGELYNAISNSEISTLAQGATAIGVFGLIYLSAECVTIIRRVLLDCVIATHEAETRESSLRKLLRMPGAFYKGSMSGEKTAQLNQGVAGFSQLIKIVCNDLFATVLIAGCTLAQVFLNAPPSMAGIMALYLLLTITISFFQIRSQNGIREKIVSKKNELDGQVCQSINNRELIRSMDAGEYEKNRLLPGILNIRNIEQRHHRFMGAFDCLKQGCKILFQVGILAFSVLLIGQGAMSPGGVITVCLLFQQLIKPIDEVYRFMDETASSLIKARALLTVAYAAEDPAFSKRSFGKNPEYTELRFQNVVIANPEKTKTIAWYDDVSIPCGKISALQGPNGCGKTTLIRCANRYYEHMQGKITLFGRDQDAFSQEDLTKLLYYTPQVSFFFAGTVRENLRYGLDRAVSDEEMADALRKVGLAGSNHNFTVLREDPMEALDCQISEKVEELSGGMKQRLSLARAYLRRPMMYVFDEITANLDGKAVDFVLGNIENYAKSIGAGIVYISHDENVVKRCEVIIPLRNKMQENAEQSAAA